MFLIMKLLQWNEQRHCKACISTFLSPCVIVRVHVSCNLKKQVATVSEVKLGQQEKWSLKIDEQADLLPE